MQNRGRFKNRLEAAEDLATVLSAYRGKNPLVLAIPRGAVPMACALAKSLGGETDVVLVHKLGAPGQPELAVGSVDESGHVYLHPYAKQLGIPAEYLKRETQAQLEVLKNRRRSYSENRPPISPTGRIVLVVDDGVATGATMIAALQTLREKSPKKLIAVTAVAPPDTLARLKQYANEVVCLMAPKEFYAVGQYFDDFPQVSDEEVLAALRPDPPAISQTIQVEVEGLNLPGQLSIPKGATGLVLFAHGSGSSHRSPRNQFVAQALQRAGIGTLLFDLLSPEEDRNYQTRFDIALLTRRLIQATRWLQGRNEARGLSMGYFGASTGAAAALVAAAELGEKIGAVVSRGGRPDLAGPALAQVRAPTLLLVGGNDFGVIELNEQALAQIPGAKEMMLVPGATHLFEEPGTLETVAKLASQWFLNFLNPGNTDGDTEIPPSGKRLAGRAASPRR